MSSMNLTAERPATSRSYLASSSPHNLIQQLQRKVKSHSKRGPNDILRALKAVDERRSGRLYPEDISKIWGFFDIVLSERKRTNIVEYLMSLISDKALKTRRWVPTKILRDELFPQTGLTGAVAAIEDEAVSVAGSHLHVPRLPLSRIGKDGKVEPIPAEVLKNEALEMVASNEKLRNLPLQATTTFADIIACFAIPADLVDGVMERITALEVTTATDLTVKVDKAGKWRDLKLPSILESALRRVCFLTNSRNSRKISELLDNVSEHLAGKFVSDLEVFAGKFSEQGVSDLGALEAAGEAIWNAVEVPIEVKLGLEAEVQKPIIDDETIAQVIKNAEKAETESREVDVMTSRSRDLVAAMGITSQAGSCPRALTAHIPDGKQFMPFGAGKAVYTPLYRRKTRPILHCYGMKKQSGGLASIPEMGPEGEGVINLVKIPLVRAQTPSDITAWLY